MLKRVRISWLGMFGGWQERENRGRDVHPSAISPATPSLAHPQRQSQKCEASLRLSIACSRYPRTRWPRNAVAPSSAHGQVEGSAHGHPPGPTLSPPVRSSGTPLRNPPLHSNYPTHYDPTRYPTRYQMVRSSGTPLQNSPLHSNCPTRKPDFHLNYPNPNQTVDYKVDCVRSTGHSTPPQDHHVPYASAARLSYR